MEKQLVDFQEMKKESHKIISNIKASEFQLPKDREYEKINDIKFEFLEDGSDRVADITVSQENIEEKAKEEIISNNWWLQDKWREKGIPEQQVSIKVGEYSLELYSFSQKIEDKRIFQLKSILEKFSNILGGEALNTVKYILIDDKNEINKYTNEPLNGYAETGEGAIKLYPPALEDKQHRISATSNFEGTLIHELSHSLASKQLDKWQKDFGWEHVPEGITTPGGLTLYFKPKDPSRCISEYAIHSAAEDFCDSMVAAIVDPDSLDPERLAFIRERVLPKESNNIFATAEVREGSDVSLPKIKQPVVVKVTPKINVVKIVKE
ncbi:MAG: hypothetical protein WCP14_02050 [bacterium]